MTPQQAEEILCDDNNWTIGQKQDFVIIIYNNEYRIYLPKDQLENFVNLILVTQNKKYLEGYYNAFQEFYHNKVL